MVSKKNDGLDIRNCSFDLCDTDNFLDIFSDPKPTFPFENIQHEQYDDLESASKEVPVNSEMESSEVLNIPDFLMNSTKTYTRKNGSVMFSHKKSAANDLVPSVEKRMGKKRTIPSKSLSFQNVRTSDVFNAGNSNEPCNSVKINRLSSKRLKKSVNSNSKKSKLIYETGDAVFEDDIAKSDECTKNVVSSSIFPCKQLNGTYARTRKNLVQKIVLGTNTDLKDSSGQHKNTRRSKRKNPITNSQSYSHSFVDSSVSLPKKSTSNKTSVHEKKDYDNTLQSLLLKFSEKPNGNFKNVVPVQKNIKQKYGFENSQSKKAPEEQTIIPPQAEFSSNVLQELKKQIETANSDLNKSPKKMIQHLNVKPRKPITRTCNEILKDKIHEKSKRVSATTLPVKGDSLDLNKELENIIFNSNQKSSTISSKNSSVKNTNCSETEYTGNINLNSNQGIKHVVNSDKPLIKNQNNSSLNQEVKVIKTSNGNILAGNPVSGILTPVVLNSGSIFNPLPQIVSPPVFQPYTYYPTTVPSLNLGNNPTIYVMPCCNCSHSPNSSGIINAFNKSISSTIPPPIFQISGDATNLDSILKQLRDFYHQPVQQTLQNTSVINPNRGQNFNVRTTITNMGSNTEKVTGNHPSQNCVENSHICDHQTDSLKPELDSVMNENLEEERLKTRSRSAKMAAFMAFTADLIKDVHGMSLKEIRYYLSKHNHDIVKRLTVSKFYTQAQDVIDSFCFTSVDNFATKYKLPNEFKNISLSTLLKDYVKFHLQHIIKAHPQRPFNVSRFSVLKQGNSQLNFFEKILFKNLCTKYQKLDLKNLIKILSFVGIITLYIQHQNKDLIHFKQKIEMGQKAK